MKGSTMLVPALSLVALATAAPLESNQHISPRQNDWWHWIFPDENQYYPTQAPSEAAPPAAPPAKPPTTPPTGSSKTSPSGGGPRFMDSALTFTADPTADDLAGASDIAKFLLSSHNDFRSQFGEYWYLKTLNKGAGALTWDSGLAQTAKDWWSSRCTFEHHGADNLFNAHGSDPSYLTIDQPVKGWGGEYTQYNYDAPGFSDVTGHFTQVVWKATTRIGCGWTVHCGQGSVYMSCIYDPPGNFQGQYPENVGRLGA